MEKFAAIYERPCERHGGEKALAEFMPIIRSPRALAGSKDDRFAQDKRIIRNRQKVLSVQANAQYIVDTAKEHGSFGKFVSRWPQDDLIGLFTHMKKRARKKPPSGIGINTGIPRYS